jgi:hypothetical protein
LKVNRRFGGKYLLNNQARRLNQARNQDAASTWLGFFFDPEDGSDMIIRNVGSLSTDYMALCPRR